LRKTNLTRLFVDVESFRLSFIAFQSEMQRVTLESELEQAKLKLCSTESRHLVEISCLKEEILALKKSVDKYRKDSESAKEETDNLRRSVLTVRRELEQSESVYHTAEQAFKMQAE
jgi:flagellar basal body rod protein FlgB